MYASRKPTIDARIVAATTAYPVGLRSFTNVSGALLDVSRRIAASVVAPTRDSDDRPLSETLRPGKPLARPQPVTVPGSKHRASANAWGFQPVKREERVMDMKLEL